MTKPNEGFAPIVHVTIGSGKMEGIRSINVNPQTNAFCQHMHQCPNADIICKHCFNDRFIKTRPELKRCLDRNTKTLTEKYIEGDWGVLPRFKTGESIRFNSYGELYNLTHVENLWKICYHNLHAHFTLWTKRGALIQEMDAIYQRPPNLTVIFSNPVIDKVRTEPPEWADKVFNVVNKNHPVESNCAGIRCADCMKCYGEHSKETTPCIIEHLK